MGKTVLETNSPAQEARVQGPEALGKKPLFLLGLELRSSADLWVYKNTTTGGICVERQPREGMVKIIFTKRGKES